MPRNDDTRPATRVTTPLREQDQSESREDRLTRRLTVTRVHLQQQQEREAMYRRHASEMFRGRTERDVATGMARQAEVQIQSLRSQIAAIETDLEVRQIAESASQGTTNRWDPEPGPLTGTASFDTARIVTGSVYLTHSSASGILSDNNQFREAITHPRIGQSAAILRGRLAQEPRAWSQATSASIRWAFHGQKVNIELAPSLDHIGLIIGTQRGSFRRRVISLYRSPRHKLSFTRHDMPMSADTTHGLTVMSRGSRGRWVIAERKE